MNGKYYFPDGYSMFQTLMGSFKLLKDPIGTISMKIAKFSGTYSANVPGKGRVIVTQDADFINYVLRENHTNYQKAKLETEAAARQLGNSLLFSNGDTWRSQRRLIQPAFHQSNIHQLYETVTNTINAFIVEIPDGEQVDIYPLMRDLSFSVLVNSLFKIDMSRQRADELCQASVDLQAFMLKDMKHLSVNFYTLLLVRKEKWFNRITV